jgi:hypothetical protein
MWLPDPALTASGPDFAVEHADEIAPLLVNAD